MSATDTVTYDEEIEHLISGAIRDSLRYSESYPLPDTLTIAESARRVRRALEEGRLTVASEVLDWYCVMADEGVSMPSGFALPVAELTVFRVMMIDLGREPIIDEAA